MGKHNSNEIRTESMVFLPELSSVASCDCTAALLLKHRGGGVQFTVHQPLPQATPTNTAYNTSSELTVSYGLSCLTEQSSALWKHDKPNGSILENKDLEYFSTTVPL